MKKAADKQPFSEEFKDYLLKQLAIPAQRILVVNQRLHDNPTTKITKNN